MPKPTAVVTGASRGIGRAIATRLAGSHDIVAAARSSRDLAALAKEIEATGGRCTTVAVDLTDPAATSRAFDGIDADVLVNNAGVGTLKPLLDLTAAQWQDMVAVNFNALYYTTRALLPGMVKRGRGHVVTVGSIAGRSAFIGGTCYAATKHAAMAFSECLMLEVRDHGVKVSVVNPGSVATDFGAPGKDQSWMLSPEAVAESVAHVIATPAHVLVHRLEIRALAPKKKG